MVLSVESATTGLALGKVEAPSTCAMDVEEDPAGEVAGILLTVGAAAQASAAGVRTPACEYNSDCGSAASAGLGASSDDESAVTSIAAMSSPEHTPMALDVVQPFAADEKVDPPTAVAAPTIVAPNSEPTEAKRPSLLGSLVSLAAQELMSLDEAPTAVPSASASTAAAAAAAGAAVAASVTQPPQATTVKPEQSTVAEPVEQEAVVGRRRPRSVSCPEGMELQGWGYRALNNVDSPVSEPEGRRTFTTIREEDEDDARALRSLRDAAIGPELAEEKQQRDKAASSAGLARFSGGSGGAGAASAAAAGLQDANGDANMLPHLLPQYTGVYNKLGRIGIYTRQEREAILARFRNKRSRRVWRKKIRYSCRKNLADKRLRVKGRFVRMSAEQRAALELELRGAAPTADSGPNPGDSEILEGGAVGLPAQEQQQQQPPTTRRRSRGASLGSEAERGMYGGQEQERGEAADADGEPEGEDGDENGEEGTSEDELPRQRVRRHSIAF